MKTNLNRRVIANEDFVLYQRHGWEICPDHKPLGGGPTDDSNGTWRDRRVVVRPTLNATLPGGRPPKPGDWVAA